MVGDEPEFRAAVADAIPGAVILNEGFETEFALMTMCAGGLLFASTFAFWAAYLAQPAHENGRFIAPKFWVGHR